LVSNPNLSHKTAKTAETAKTAKLCHSDRGPA
jgi:hypothetical protein